MPGTRKLGRPTDQRMAMLRGMVTYLLENGRIETTLTRAKEVSALAEKMITLGKKGDLAAYRQALAFITKEDVAHDLFTILAPKMAKRNGGYTRIYKLGPRRGDGAEMAIIELVTVREEMEAAEKKKKAAAKRAAAKKAPKKVEAPVSVEEADQAAAEEIKAEVEEEVKKATAKKTAEKAEAAEVVEEAATEEAAE